MAYDIATIGELGDTGATPCCSACAQATMGGVGDGPSEAAELTQVGFLPTIVWPSDVDAYKKKIDPDFRSTDRAVAGCTGVLAAPVIAGWTNFNTSWRQFADAGTRIVGSWEQQLNEAKRFESELAKWQQQLVASGCKLLAPPISPPSTPINVGLVIGAVAVVGIAAALAYSLYRAGSHASSRAAAGRDFLESRADALISGGGSGRALARR